jgi:hypothetical protein
VVERESASASESTAWFAMSDMMPQDGTRLLDEEPE